MAIVEPPPSVLQKFIGLAWLSPAAPYKLPIVSHVEGPGIVVGSMVRCAPHRTPTMYLLLRLWWNTLQLLAVRRDTSIHINEQFGPRYDARS